MTLLRSLTVVTVLLLATGCGGAGGAASDDTDLPDGLLTRTAPNQDEMDAIVGGTLDLGRGCVLLSGNPVIWPWGTTLSDDPPQVLLPNGVTANQGDVVRGGGGYVPAAGLDRTAIKVKGNVTKALSCAAADSEIVVFTARGDDITIAPAG